MEIITLKNGLKVFLDKTPNLKTALVGVWAAAGSRFENSDESGISHFIEHIVFKGSMKRSGLEILEGMDEIGAQVNAYTTKHCTYFYTKALDYQLLSAADILFDMVVNPALNEKDIETEKGVILEEIAMYEDDPEDVATELNEKSIYEGSDLYGDILGTRESVKGITKEKIISYRKRFYRPERMVIGVSGNFNREEVIEKIEEYFGNLENEGRAVELKKAEYKKTLNLKKTDTEQNHIILSFPGVEIRHEDEYPLQVVMFILGAGLSSLLSQRLREELGLVYSVDSWLMRYYKEGYIAISLALSPKNEEKAIVETLKLLSSFSKNITEKKLSAIKEKLTASFIMSSELPQSRHSSIGKALLYFGDYIDDEEVIKKIKAVTLEEISRLGEKYFDLSALSFTAVGRVKEREEYEKIIEKSLGEWKN